MPETPAPSNSAPAPPDFPPPPLPLPLFWPVAVVAGMEKAKADLALRNLEFVQEELKLHGQLKPKLATPNVVRLDLRKKRSPVGSIIKIGHRRRGDLALPHLLLMQTKVSY